MQNSILLSDAQVRPAGISVEEGIKALKCEIKKLAKTKSETFSYICGETVTYGEVVLTMVGFLDGINDSLKVQNPIETMDENTTVSLCFDKELLYKNMVDAKADWLYNLPQWDKIFTPEKRKELYLEQKKSGTVVKAHKIGRNDPCPCGSGKKYKFCCGRNK